MGRSQSHLEIGGRRLQVTLATFEPNGIRQVSTNFQRFIAVTTCRHELQTVRCKRFTQFTHASKRSFAGRDSRVTNRTSTQGTPGMHSSKFAWLPDTLSSMEYLQAKCLWMSLAKHGCTWLYQLYPLILSSFRWMYRTENI